MFDRIFSSTFRRACSAPLTHQYHREAEANTFAMALLMQREWVIEYWHKLETPDVAQMAKMFGVEKFRMRQRLIDLDLLHNHRKFPNVTPPAKKP